VLVAAYGFAPSAGLAFAWVHAVALGWLTLIALAVLVHGVPGMTELRRGSRRNPPAFSYFCSFLL
jgi:hypothetical protein